MKRKILSLALCCLCTIALKAQEINKQYIHTNPNESTFGQKVAVISDDRIIFSSNNINGSGVYTSVDLTGTDPAGSYFNSVTVNFPMNHHHIMKTSTNNGRLMVAGYSSDPSLSGVLWIMQLDPMTFIPDWSRRVPILPKSPIAGITDFENVDIEEIFDPNTGLYNYFISFTEGCTQAGYEDLPSFGMVKMDENGGFIWHKLYENILISNQIHATTSFVESEGSPVKLSIASTISPINKTNPFTFFFDRPAYVTIDQDGIPQTSLIEAWTSDIGEYMPDIVWDGDNFVSVFTSRSGSQDPALVALTTLGIWKMDLGYNVVEHGLFWAFINPNIWGYRNTAAGITLGQNNDYIISGWVNEYESPNPPGPPVLDFKRGPIIFPLAKSALLSSNIPATSLYNSTTSYRPDLLTYYNQFHITRSNGYSLLIPTQDEITDLRPRLIQTNPYVLDNCINIPVTLNSVRYQIQQNRWDFNIIDFTEYSDEPLEIFDSFFEDEACPYPNPPKPLAVEHVDNQSTARLYPNIVGEADRFVACEFAHVEGGLQIRVANTVGQTLFETTIGHNASTYQLPADKLQTGVNFITIYASGKRIYSGKVVKQ